jgi:hypothetical protein
VVTRRLRIRMPSIQFNFLSKRRLFGTIIAIDFRKAADRRPQRAL